MNLIKGLKLWCIVLFKLIIYCRRAVLPTAEKIQSNSITMFLVNCLLACLNKKFKWIIVITLFRSSVFSWKLKKAFLIIFCMLSVCKLFTFSRSSPEPVGQFQPNLAQSTRWLELRSLKVLDRSLLPLPVDDGPTIVILCTGGWPPPRE